MEEKRLKIGLFNDTFFPMVDGVVMVVDNYARRLSKFCDVVVFVPSGRTDFDDSTLPYKVVRCNSKFPVVFLDYDLPLPNSDAKFLKQLKNEHLDLVHIHSPFSIGKLGVKYAKKHNIPVIATMHSQYYKDFLLATKSKFISKQLLKNIVRVFNECTEVWTMNPACEELSRTYGYKGKIRLIPNGTNLINNTSVQEQSEYIKEIKMRHNIQEDEKVLFYIGRMHKLKNLDFVIEVCKHLKEKEFKFKMLFVGGGAHISYFMRKVKNLKLDDVIIFVGPVYDNIEKSKYIMSADLQIFPSFYDTDGIVRIEAAAYNVPTVFIENSIASSVITDKVNGYIGENNVQLYAEKIINIFNNNDNYQKVKQKCKEDIYITWEEISKNVLTSYKEVIAEFHTQTLRQTTLKLNRKALKTKHT